jgi:hypothetical protein
MRNLTGHKVYIPYPPGWENQKHCVFQYFSIYLVLLWLFVLEYMEDLAGVLDRGGIFHWDARLPALDRQTHDLRRVNLAFMTANGIASVVFAIFVIADLFVHV